MLTKGVSETTQNEAKEQEGRFPSMLLGTLSGNLLTDKGTIRTDQGTIRAVQNF